VPNNPILIDYVRRLHAFVLFAMKTTAMWIRRCGRHHDNTISHRTGKTFQLVSTPNWSISGGAGGVGGLLRVRASPRLASKGYSLPQANIDR